MFASKCQLLSERSTSTQQLTATSKCDNPTSTLNGPGRLPALASSLFHTCHCHTLFSMSRKSNWQNKNLRELLNRGWWIETKKINKVNASWKLLAYSGEIFEVLGMKERGHDGKFGEWNIFIMVGRQIQRLVCCWCVSSLYLHRHHFGKRHHKLYCHKVWKFWHDLVLQICRREWLPKYHCLRSASMCSK